jgi:hypothetical protein
MHTQRTLAATAIFATFILSAWRANPAPPTPSPLAATAASAPEACTLLTEAQVSAAIEGKSLPGKRPVPSSAAFCIWSDDPNNAISNRRVTLSMISTATFERGKAGRPKVTIEAVSAIGDEAYYEVYKSESPLLVVRKGGSAFTVRILNGLKFKELAQDAVKAKEAELGKAAAAKL